jgi:hypothetical protein
MKNIVIAAGLPPVPRKPDQKVQCAMDPPFFCGLGRPGNDLVNLGEVYPPRAEGKIIIFEEYRIFGDLNQSVRVNVL